MKDNHIECIELHASNHPDISWGPYFQVWVFRYTHGEIATSHSYEKVKPTSVARIFRAMQALTRRTAA